VFAGLAYVYVRNGTSWTQQAVLVASDPAPVDYTGWSVAIDGDTIVVGSYANNAGGTDSGAAYVFTRTGTTWTQQAKLVANDAQAGDGFGYSVAIDGNTAAIGAPRDDDAGQNSGSAYVFSRSGTTWTQQAKMIPLDGSTPGDDFGFSVDIDSGTLLVGSHLDDDYGDGSGSAYVYTTDGSTWSEQAKLNDANAAPGDEFGYSVSLHGDTAMISSPFHDGAAGTDSGSVEMFTRNAGTWSQSATLTAADASAGDAFGIAVALDTTIAVVGAYSDADFGPESGSAYVFSGSGPTWNQLTKLTASDGDAGDRFGVSVAISGDIVVGSYLDDDKGSNSGSAYVFAP
jgi:hypothetical protein